MRRLLWLLLPACVLAMDLGSKAWILDLLAEGESKPVIKGFFYLTLGFNRGAIFGSLTWLPAMARFILFALAGLAALIIICRMFLEKGTGTWHYWTFNLADSFILVGAVLYGLRMLMAPREEHRTTGN